MCKRLEALRGDLEAALTAAKDAADTLAVAWHAAGDWSEEAGEAADLLRSNVLEALDVILDVGLEEAADALEEVMGGADRISKSWRGYPAALAWLASNADVGEDVEEAAGTVLVGFLADMTGRAPLEVARDLEHAGAFEPA